MAGDTGDTSARFSNQKLSELQNGACPHGTVSYDRKGQKCENVKNANYIVKIGWKAAQHVCDTIWMRALMSNHVRAKAQTKKFAKSDFYVMRTEKWTLRTRKLSNRKLWRRAMAQKKRQSLAHVASPTRMFESKIWLSTMRKSPTGGDDVWARESKHQKCRRKFE